MQNYSNLKVLGIISLLSYLMLISCVTPQSKLSEESNDKELASYDYRYKIRHAIVEEESALFASLCRYPIHRKYPLRDIEDSAAMVKYFNVLIDDSLKNVLKSTDADDWNGPIAWFGTTLLDGTYLWCDDGVIYSIPYQSGREIELIDSLQHAVMATLPANLADGWIPEICLTDSVGTIYRIDKSISDKEDLCRLLVYFPGKDRFQSSPSKILYGTLSFQGSAGTPEYTFANPDGSIWTYCFLWFDDAHSLFIDTQDDAGQNIPLEKTHWLK